MKKLLLVLIAVLMLGSVLAGCAPKEEAVVLGPALLTVSGKIGSPNSGETFVVDQALFDAKAVEITMDDPWMGEGIAYKGILIRDLLTAMKVPEDATTIRVVATDGKGIDIAIADAKKWDIMLVHWADGVELSNDIGGPVKIAFPADARATYVDDMWMWWLTTAEVK
jgi:hypothetical protein